MHPLLTVQPLDERSMAAKVRDPVPAHYMLTGHFSSENRKWPPNASHFCLSGLEMNCFSAYSPIY